MSARHVWAAFWARPFGMPVPPNLFGLAAFAALGALLDPAFLLIGAGLEVAYLLALSASPRFRAVVDGARGDDRQAGQRDQRHQAVWARLARVDQEAQAALEARCDEILETLAQRGATSTHADGLARLAWMHLRLLAAREALERVMAGGAAEAGALEAQAAALATRLAAPGLPEELQRTLAQQAEVIGQRREAHAEAARRRERVQAELERIRQQVSLVREQVLLATDEAGVASSVDSLSASLDDASRWLSDQQELLGGLDDLTAPPPSSLLGRSRRRTSTSTGASA
ncbi:MAG: hypothetical protein IPO09_03275 [Anaeromyxobacter sp.]|nr:hypothetical protein [Anaeromyxobacter sp.]MBL0275605.1 hypothetical protein [Anaeromyxobacter sp.]